jgi:hypothetical protein
VELGGPFRVLARQLWIKATDRRFPATGAVITPTAVQAGSSDSGAEAANLTSRRGLRNRVHTVNPAHMWRSAKGETSCWIEFDLGEPQPVSTIAVWNYNDTWHTDRGVRTADISVWTEEAGWRKVHSDLSLEQAEGSDNYDEPTYVELDAVMARKVRFDAHSNFGDPDHIGLSEVGFFRPRGPEASDPWPADGAKGITMSGLVLTWSPGEGTVARDVYIGTDPGGLRLLGRIEDVRAGISQLADQTKYFWRIDEIRTDGSVAKGDTWSFTTGGLAGWWKLDEGEGTTVSDSSGKDHHGVIHGSPIWLPEGGRIGGALQFDGVKDYVDTGWADHLPVWTVAAWVKSPEAPKGPVASGPVHREANFQINWDHGESHCRGAAVLRVGGTWHAAGFGGLKADTWYHLAATYDGESLRAYRDGVLTMENTDPSGHADPESAPLTFGRHATATSAFFTGTIDEVCVFAYPLSAEDIKALYSGGGPAAVVARAAPSEPRLLEPSATVVTEPAAEGRPPAKVQPVAAPSRRN